MTSTPTIGASELAVTVGATGARAVMPDRWFTDEDVCCELCGDDNCNCIEQLQDETTNNNEDDMGNYGKYGDNVKSGDGGKFVNLKDKEKITFVLMGEPGETHLLFPEGGGKPTSVPVGTPRAQLKVGMPIYDVVLKSARLLQLSPNTFKELDALVGELGEDRVYRVSRSGSGMMDTRYTVTSIEKADAALLEAVRRTQPVDITEEGFKPLQIVDDSERQPGDETETEKPRSDGAAADGGPIF